MANLANDENVDGAPDLGDIVTD